MTYPGRPSLDEIVAATDGPGRRPSLDEIVAEAEADPSFADVSGGSSTGKPIQSFGRMGPMGLGRSAAQMATAMTPGQAAATAAQGATFNFADEAVGGLAGLGTLVATGGDMDRAAQAVESGRALINDPARTMQRNHPIASAATQMAGGMVTGIPLLKAVRPASSLAARVLQGAGIGAASGGVAGLGAGEGGTRLDRAGEGMAGGALVGATIPLATAGLKAAVTPLTQNARVQGMLDDLATRLNVKRVNPTRAAQELDATRTNLTQADYEAARPQVVSITPTMRKAMDHPEFVAADREAATLAATEGKPYTSPFGKDGVADEADINSLQRLKQAVNERLKAAKKAMATPDPTGTTVTPSARYDKAVGGRNRAVVGGIADQSEEFARAEKNFATLSREIDQLRLGQRYRKPTQFETPEALTDHVDALPANERTRFLQGVLAKAERDALKSPEDKIAYTRLFGNADVQQRFRALIPKEADKRAFDRMIERAGSFALLRNAMRRSLVFQTGIGPVLRGVNVARDFVGQEGGRAGAELLDQNKALLAFLLGQRAGAP